MSNSLSKDDVVEIIVKKTSKSKEEINKMIQETVEMMDNMVNEEGAAYVVANNLGVIIDLDHTTEAYKIDQLTVGQTNVSVIGRVSKIFSVREFKRKDNTTGKVRNLEITDKTGSIRISLWDSKTDLIDEKQIIINILVRIVGANTKIGFRDKIELVLGSHGQIDTNIPDVDVSEYPEISYAKLIPIESITGSMNEVSIEGKIIDRQPIIDFEKNDKSGKVTSLTIQDLTQSIRITFWNENCKKTEQFKIEDEIQLHNLRVGENKFGNLELTFNDYSSIKKSDSEKYSSIKANLAIDVNSISEITENQSNINVIGKLISKGDIRNFDKNGRSGKVANLTISDKTGSIKVVVWGDLTDMLEKINIGQLVKFVKVQSRINSYSNEIELSCNNKTTIELELNESPNEEKFEIKPVKLSEITTTIDGADTIVQISSIYDEREVQLKDGNTSKVKNISVIDTDGVNGRIAAWNEEINKLMDLETNDVVKLSFVKIKPAKDPYPPEITITRNTTIEKLDSNDFLPIIQSADKLQNSQFYQKATLDHLTEGTKVKVKGTIVKAFKPFIYNSCNQCARKIVINDQSSDMGVCETHGEVPIQNRLILTLIIDDTNATCLIKLFGENAEKILGMNANQAKELIERLSDEMSPITKSEIEMKEIWIEGKVFRNENNETFEINANNVDFVKLNDETNQILNKFS